MMWPGNACVIDMFVGQEMYMSGPLVENWARKTVKKSAMITHFPKEMVYMIAGFAGGHNELSPLSDVQHT